MIVFAKSPSPKEERVVPLLADPAVRVLVGLKVESPAMAMLHGLLVTDEPS